jgi:hypothetical protein
MLCLLFVALIWLKIAYEHLPLTMWQMLQLYFSVWNGWAMAVMIVVLSATYPYFGFVRRTVVANIITDREQIEAAMVTAGLVLKGAEGNTLTFRSDCPDRKIDYVFVTKDVRVLCAEIPEIIASDHRPHTAEIDF